MNLTQEQKDQVNSLIDYRDEMSNGLFHIERILKTYFPEEFERALQFYLPQITTSLHDHEKWLNRGEYSLQNTIDNLLERCKMTEAAGGLKKYL